MATSLLNKPKISWLQALIVLVLLLPLWMSLSWFFTKRRILVAAVIDKTVLTQNGQEHISLTWVLNHEKFAKNDRTLYNNKRDYFGFFPEEKEQFRLKGLERFSNDKLTQLSNDADLAYITDSYGIYKNEWYKQGDAKERSGIVYGGMSKQDLFLLQKMKERHKLVITEFNCLGSPTDSSVRKGFENAFGIHWSGWIGRYFDSFDTTKNKELPRWLIYNYKIRHRGEWPFKKSGIAFIHSDDRVVILENDTHLVNELPHIYASTEAITEYGVPKKIHYAFWFDVISVDTNINKVIAHYEIDANKTGLAVLAENGIPAQFPAITLHSKKDYRFFYFSGDFCDNPIELGSSYFTGVHFFRWFMYNKLDPQERKSFFWTFYRPLVSRILNDYYEQKP